MRSVPSLLTSQPHPDADLFVRSSAYILPLLAYEEPASVASLFPQVVILENDNVRRGFIPVTAGVA